MLRFHAAEWDIGFGYFVFVVDLEIVGALIRGVVPGPTTGLGLVVCCGLSLLNTNAIKFIIMPYLIQLTKLTPCFE